jgi:two-component system chemotaxis response regulator CheY
MKFTGSVLLVDDEPHIRKFIGLLLKQFSDPRLIEAANGEEALEIYARERPDLVLLDLNMPKLGGIETLRKLRELDPDSIVVMLTSLATRQVIEEAAALGAVNYIRKDTPKEEITKALRTTIEDQFDLSNGEKETP